MKYVLALLLAACNHFPAKCISTCGMELDSSAPWTCEEFQSVEDNAMTAFLHTKDERLHWCGDKLKEYKVLLRPGDSFMIDGDYSVRGVTWCEKKEMEVAIRDGTAIHTALSHEMVHALQNCQPSEPVDLNDYFHSNWERDYIYQAIDYIREGK